MQCQSDAQEEKADDDEDRSSDLRSAEVAQIVGVGIGQRTVGQHREGNAGHQKTAGKEQDQCRALACRPEGSTGHDHSALHLLYPEPVNQRLHRLIKS